MAFNFWREVAAWIRGQPFADGFAIVHQRIPEGEHFIAIIGYENGAPYGMHSPVDRGIQVESFQIIVQHKEDETAYSVCETIRQAFNRQRIPLDTCTILPYPRGTCYRASWTAKFQYRCNMSADVPSAAYRQGPFEGVIP